VTTSDSGKDPLSSSGLGGGSAVLLVPLRVAITFQLVIGSTLAFRVHSTVAGAAKFILKLKDVHLNGANSVTASRQDNDLFRDSMGR